MDRYGVPLIRIRAWDNTTVDGFTRMHCPVPKCIGGPKTWNNLVENGRVFKMLCRTIVARLAEDVPEQGGQ